MVITTGDGNKLPNPSTDGAFNLTIYNADDPFVTPEIVRCTAKSGDSLTITRAQEGTTATNKTTGSTWYVELVPTAKTIQDIDDKKLDIAGGTLTGDLTIPDKIIHSGDTNTAIRFPSADTVTVETGGTEALRVTSAQRVGVNTTSPSQPLHVTGNSFLNGTLILPANARIFTKTISLADDTDTTLLTITAPGSGANIQTSLLIFVSLEGRWGVTTRASGSALYHYNFVKVIGGDKATSLQDIKALNFVTDNTFLINLTSHSFTDNDVDATTNTISAKFTSSGTSTRTFIARVTVLIQGVTPAIIT
jgi:hypothetical protein